MFDACTEITVKCHHIVLTSAAHKVILEINRIVMDATFFEGCFISNLRGIILILSKNAALDRIHYQVNRMTYTSSEFFSAFLKGAAL